VSRQTDDEGNLLNDRRRLEILASAPYGLTVKRSAMVKKRAQQP
jgi:hypothetical protein